MTIRYDIESNFNWLSIQFWYTLCYITELYEKLGEKGLNMREWFLINANAYLKQNKPNSLLIGADNQKAKS